MGIKINWTDFNTLEPDEFRVYRSSTPIDPLNPPAALTTVLGSVREYEDTTTLRNTVYHYAVSAYTEGKGEIFSRSMCTGYFPYTGPGPQTLLRGDYNSGIFGDFPIADLFMPSDLKTAVGAPGTLITSATRWIKAASRGKIIFFPNVGIASNVSFDSLFATGLVYSGIPQAEWPPQSLVGRSLVAQNKTIIKGDDVFNVRLPSARRNRLSNAAVTADYFGGDCDLAIAASFRLNMPNGLDLWQLYDHVPPAATTYAHSGDFAGTSVITRSFTAGTDISSSGTMVSSATGGLWLPILELVL